MVQMNEPTTDTEASAAPRGKPFEPGRTKTGGRQRGSANIVPSPRKLRRQLLTHVYGVLKDLAATREQRYRDDPVAAVKADLQSSRDCIELLGRVDELAGPAKSATSGATIEARAAATGPISDEQAMSTYLQLVKLEPGSDAARLLLARSALGERARLDRELTAIATAAHVTVDVVRQVLDALPVLGPPPAPAVEPAPPRPADPVPLRAVRVRHVPPQLSAAAAAIELDPRTGQVVLPPVAIPAPAQDTLLEGSLLEQQRAWLRGY